MNAEIETLDSGPVFGFAHDTKWLDPLLQSCGSRRTAPSARVETDPTFAVRLCAEPTGLRTVVAASPEQLKAAEELVRRRYAWRGYRLCAVDDFGETTCPEVARPMTLLAINDGSLLGTLTLRPDSPRGLLAEQTYKGEIENMRRNGRRLGELIRLAVEEGAEWKAAFDALAQAAYFVTRLVHALTDILIEVNPRHVRFHERVFGFVVTATGRLCSRVDAPSVLMRLDVEQFGRRLQLCAA